MTKVRAHVALRLAAALSALALGQSAAFAADATAAVTGADSVDALQEVVVTAQFRSESLQTTPLAITAISGEQMEARNMATLVDVANSAPNVTMFEASAPFGKTAAAFIRGIGQGDFNLAAGEPGVGVYVDDVYFATTYGSVFDLLDLERVEVLRGPQGTLFGKNSIGGAIRLISKKPQGDDTGYIQATLGDFNRRDFKAGFDIPIVKDNLFLRVSLMAKQRDGYVKRLAYGCVNPQPAAGSGATTDSRGYVVNTFAPNYLGANTGTQNNSSCVTGTEGGENVHGGRAQLRWVASDKLENLFSAYVIDDTSEAAPEVLLEGNANPGPGNPGAPALAAYNTTYMLPLFGMAYDSRFLTHNYYSTYSSFYDQINHVEIPPVNRLHSYGFTDTVDWTIAGDLKFKSITAYLGYWGDFSDDQDNSPLPIASAYNILDHHQFTQELRLTGSAFGGKTDWATGLFYFDGTSVNRGTVNIQYNAGGNFALYPVPGVIPFGAPGGLPTPGNFFGLENFQQNSPATDKNEGVFVQATQHITDSLNLTAGVRETHEKKTYVYQSFFGRVGPFEESYSHLDGTLSLNYQWTPAVMTYVSASTGFRGGGFNPRPFAETQINAFAPEKLTEYEVGLKSEWLDRRLRANLAAFYGNYTNLQLNSQTTQGGIPYTGIFNVGKARITGFEAELEGHPFGGLVATLSGGYTDFKYQNLGATVGCQSVANPIPAGTPGVPASADNCVAGNAGYSDRPPGQPKLKVSFGLSYALNLGNGGSITPRVDVTYQDEVFADVINQTPGAIMPGRTLMNGRIEWAARDGDWTVAALGTNLTNKQYYLSIFDLRAFGEGQMSAQPGAPREWAIQIQRNFGK